MSSILPASFPIIDESKKDSFDLVALLLAEQQSLTAVQRFSALHDSSDEPAQARYYRALLPATPPGPGQQFGFKVDLDACSGCKACVVACHTLNGLEDDESWRRVGTMTLGEGPQSRIQHVTTACHHCEDPGCLNGCPVRAYEKDPATGIVLHLDDQCIGCKYCTMMCPYEVPQYSDRLGIVRKCDMCHQRLSEGEAPACVQACPNEAISIQLVQTGEKVFAADDCVTPGAPASAITRPSTCYVSGHENGIRDATAQDSGVDEVAESHWPLAVMLVATQISVGMLLAERLSAAALWLAGSAMPIEATRVSTLLAFVIGAIGLNVAPLHLGQPLRAWRVFLGLRTSWLSREAVILGKYVGALAAALALLWLPVYVHYVPEAVAAQIPSWAANAMLGTAILLGVAGLFSSAMIYIATRRRLWRLQRTLTRFFGTAAICGLACCAGALIYAQTPIGAIVIASLVSIVLALSKLDWEFQIHLGSPQEREDDYDRRSSKLVNQPLSRVKLARVGSAFGGVALLAGGMIATFAGWPSVALVGVAAGAMSLAAGETCERILYFSSVVYDRMPGTLR